MPPQFSMKYAARSLVSLTPVASSLPSARWSETIGPSPLGSSAPIDDNKHDVARPRRRYRLRPRVGDRAPAPPADRRRRTSGGNERIDALGAGERLAERRGVVEVGDRHLGAPGLPRCALLLVANDDANLLAGGEQRRCDDRTGVYPKLLR